MLLRPPPSPRIYKTTYLILPRIIARTIPRHLTHLPTSTTPTDAFTSTTRFHLRLQYVPLRFKNKRQHSRPLVICLLTTSTTPPAYSDFLTTTTNTPTNYYISKIQARRLPTPSIFRIVHRKYKRTSTSSVIPPTHCHLSFSKTPKNIHKSSILSNLSDIKDPTYQIFYHS
jgi:hypothetical protein